MKLCPPKPAKFLQLINKYWPQPISVIPQHPLQSFQTFDCKRIIFSVYNIWWTINFPLFSMDLIWWLIKIHFLSLFKLHTRFFFIGCKTYPLEVETKVHSMLAFSYWDCEFIWTQVDQFLSIARFFYLLTVRRKITQYVTFHFVLRMCMVQLLDIQFIAVNRPNRQLYMYIQPLTF